MVEPGMKGVKGSWKNEWMVTPPALMAATPVGATTINRFDDFSTTVFRNVVLPVPALPVRNMRNSSFFSILYMFKALFGEM